MRLSLIVAHAQNRVIGIQNRLPWSLPEDLKRFRAITLDHPVVMGRKTFDSIGRVLPHRENLIITRRKEFEAPGALVFSSLESAIAYCEPKYSEVFVIGGAEIYALALALVDRLYVTLVHQEYEGDAFFPAYDLEKFREVSREDRPGGPTHPAYSFLVLDRI